MPPPRSGMREDFANRGRSPLAAFPTRACRPSGKTAPLPTSESVEPTGRLLAAVEALEPGLPRDGPSKTRRKSQGVPARSFAPIWDGSCSDLRGIALPTPLARLLPEGSH